jgi:hypothetical protein
MSIWTEIDDDYATCAGTYATLCIYDDHLVPDAVTRKLGVEPSGSQIKGHPSSDRHGRVYIPEIGGWFLSTKGHVVSRDVRRHLEWLLDRLAGCEHALKSFQDNAYRMEVSCYWLSAEGQGGPILSPDIMRRLGGLGLAVGFDIYGESSCVTSHP